jgi:hypothetical protein
MQHLIVKYSPSSLYFPKLSTVLSISLRRALKLRSSSSPLLLDPFSDGTRQRAKQRPAPLAIENINNTHFVRS